MVNSEIISYFKVEQPKNNYKGNNVKTEQGKEKKSFEEIFDNEVAWGENGGKYNSRTDKESEKDNRIVSDNQKNNQTLDNVNDKYSYRKVNHKKEEKAKTVDNNMEGINEEDLKTKESGEILNINPSSIQNLYTLLSNLKEILNQQNIVQGTQSEQCFNKIYDLTSKLEKLLEKITLMDNQQNYEQLIHTIQELEQDFSRLIETQNFIAKSEVVENIQSILDALLSKNNVKTHSVKQTDNKEDNNTVYHTANKSLNSSNTDVEYDEVINEKVDKQVENTKITLKENTFTQFKKAEENNNTLNNLNVDLDTQIKQHADLKESKNIANNSLYEKIYLNKLDKNSVIEQIIDKAKLIIKDNRSEMKINLKPEILGQLSLKVAVEKGIVTAKAIVENYEVKQLIESNLTQLKDNLEEQGITVQKFDVYVGKDSDSNSQYLGYRNGQANKNKKLKASIYTIEKEYEKLIGTTQNAYTISNGSIDIIA